MLSKADRQKIVAEFCARHGGRYEPAAFLSEAASPQHPAHDWFTWDDEAAATQHRLWEARNFVRDLRVSFRVETIQRGVSGVVMVEAPAMISPAAARKAGGGYVAVGPDSPCAMAALSAEAAKALAAWMRRYGGAVAWAGGSVAAIEKQAALLEKASAREVEAA